MVVGPSVSDVVRLLGGWVFDRVTAGWDATVAVAEHADVRPLQILGARTCDLETALANQSGPIPQVIAVSVDLFQADDRIKAGVLATLDRGDMDVTLWGENWPANLDERFCTGQHRLSGAAKVFKAQAITAANAPAGVLAGTEVLRTAESLSPRGGLRLVSAS